MTRIAALVAALALVVTAGCSTGGSEPDSEALEESVSVGEGVQPIATTTTLAQSENAAPPSTSAAAETAGVAGTAPTSNAPKNLSVRDDPSGFRLSLVVGNHVRFPSDSAINFELTYENRSNRILVVDTDPQLSFVIRDKKGVDRWRNADCRTAGSTGGPDDTPGYGMAPGESAQLDGTYPFDHRFSRGAAAFDSERCKLPAGAYDVFGVLEWCAQDNPPEPGPNAVNACADGTTKIVMSAPVAIEIVDA